MPRFNSLHEFDGCHASARCHRIIRAHLRHIVSTLKPFGKPLFDGLLDHAGAGKPDQRFRFCNDDITEHGEAGCDAAKRWIGENRDEGDTRIAESPDRRRRFGHLHEGEHALLHSRATRGRDDDQRRPCFTRGLSSNENFLADNGPHAPSHKGEIEDAQIDVVSVDSALPDDNRIGAAGLVLRALQAVGIWLGILKPQDVLGLQIFPSLCTRVVYLQCSAKGHQAYEERLTAVYICEVLTMV